MVITIYLMLFMAIVSHFNIACASITESSASSSPSSDVKFFCPRFFCANNEEIIRQPGFHLTVD